MSDNMDDIIWQEIQDSYKAFISNNVNFSCEYCQINFQTEDMLFKHFEGTHKVARAKYQEDNSGYVKFQAEYFCQLCSEPFFNLKIHLDDRHDNMKTEVYYMRYIFRDPAASHIDYNQDYETELESEDSNSNCESNCNVTIMMAKEHEDLQIKDCKKNILKKFTKHIQNRSQINILTNTAQQNEIMNPGNITHTCSQCYRVFKHKRNMDRHMMIHTGEKPFQCEHCDKSFNQKCHLDIHVRVHTGEKPFQCEYCDKSFNQKCNLDVHVRVHTGEKPFQCEYCDKSFNQKCNLDVHARVHTGEKPFQCDYCDKTFARSSNLSAHKRTHVK